MRYSFKYLFYSFLTIALLVEISCVYSAACQIQEIFNFDEASELPIENDKTEVDLQKTKKVKLKPPTVQKRKSNYCKLSAFTDYIFYKGPITPKDLIIQSQRWRI